ncbi:MAG: Fic family protein [Cyanobacteria bacterium P01_D01_bin.1]
MTWIHQQSDWPAFVWDSAALAQKLANIRHQQGRLLGRMESLGFELRAEASLDTLTVEVVKSSAIEGEVLSTSEVRSSLAHKLGIDTGGTITVGRNVEGIVEVMIDATRQYNQPLTKERLFDWHAALFPTGRSGIRRITVGSWRPESAGAMQVISGRIGRERVHFEAPEASRVESEMTAFLEWFDSDEAVDPVLRAAITHLWFVTIHPFEDGNGRIARAIADLALARADNLPERFYSMSAQIEAERKTYYKQLERQQRGSIDIADWIDWFLGCLGRSIEAADATLAVVLHKAELWGIANRHPINDRQRSILNRMLNGFKGHMNTSKYAKIAKCSTDTALRDIRNLLTYGLLVRNTPGGRSTSYRLQTIEELKHRSVLD